MIDASRRCRCHGEVMDRSRSDGAYRCVVRRRVAHRVRQARYLATAHGRVQRKVTMRASNAKRIHAGATYLGRAATAVEADVLAAVASARKLAFLAQQAAERHAQEHLWR